MFIGLPNTEYAKSNESNFVANPKSIIFICADNKFKFSLSFSFSKDNKILSSLISL